MSAAAKLKSVGPHLERQLAELRDEIARDRHRGQDRKARMVESILEDIEAAIARDEERAGFISEVARETGYDPSHLHAAVRDGLLEDLAGEGESRKVRYRDVLALGHRAPPGIPKVRTKKNGRSRKGSTVKVTVME